MGYNYQPGSYTPARPFDPPTHWIQQQLIQQNYKVLQFTATYTGICLLIL